MQQVLTHVLRLLLDEMMQISLCLTVYEIAYKM